MKITAALLGEHAVFYAQFTFLEENFEAITEQALLAAQAALLEAALASHANLEETLLFQELEPLIGSGGPLAMMRMEHDQIEENLARIPGSKTLGQVRQTLFQTIQIARNHFAKEEQILYPLAERSLGEDRLVELGEKWGAARRVNLTSQRPF